VQTDTAPASNQHTSYEIDRNASRFVVRAAATGLFSALGHSPTIAIRDFTGEVRLAPDPSLRVRVRADSLEITDDIPGKDRSEMERTMKQDILQTSKYAEILYESSGATLTSIGEDRWQANLQGNLTLRGITRGQSIAMQVTRMGDMLRAGGDFTLLQSDFGIKPVSVAGGTLKLKDELKFTFDIVARKKETEMRE
jgi:polyisoprenoid-binding protein YceI